MVEIIVDDLVQPINEPISKNLIGKIPIPKDDNCKIAHFTSRWRIEKDGKHTCLEFKEVK